MHTVSEGERFLRAFHDAQPGITARAFGRGGSYVRLAARVRQGRVLDLACGDGTLLELLGPKAIGIDLSRSESDRARARGTCTIGRAQQLPFRDHAFDAATCHLAFMLFDEIQLVVAELARVLKPGVPFIALLGGGPTADGNDAFHRFAAMLPRGDVFGDPRASTEAGWRELFIGWRYISFERWELDLSGPFDEVWAFLSSSYQLRDHDRVRAALRAELSGDHVPCTVATYCATATR
jgi:SAM-dependent methyltransferase